MRESKDLRKLGEMSKGRLRYIDEVFQKNFVFRHYWRRDKFGKICPVQNMLRINNGSEIEQEHKKVVAAFLVIEIDNLIVNVFREYMTCVVLGSRKPEGGYHTCLAGAGEVSDARRLILQDLRPALVQQMGSDRNYTVGDFPPVRDPVRMYNILRGLGVSDLRRLQNALNVPTSLFRYIGTIRNFFAHRNGDTSAKVVDVFRDLGYPNAGNPEMITEIVPEGAHGRILWLWINDLHEFFRQLLE